MGRGGAGGPTPATSGILRILEEPDLQEGLAEPDPPLGQVPTLGS